MIKKLLKHSNRLIKIKNKLSLKMNGIMHSNKEILIFSKFKKN